MTKFSDFSLLLAKIEGTAGSLDMTGILADFFSNLSDEELSIAVRFCMGRIFPAWSCSETGLGPSLLYTAISKAAGISPKDVENLVKETGDVGTAAGRALSGARKGQVTFANFIEEEDHLSLTDVYASLQKVSEASGKGSQDKKMAYLQKLFSECEPEEAIYIARLAIEELRVGVGEGIIRDSIAQAFNSSAALIERGYMITNDIGEVAKVAKNYGDEGLGKLTVTIGHPIKLMLAQRAESITSAVDGKVAIEWKYDGARVQIHKQGNAVTIYSRGLENITDSLPDVAELVKEQVTADSVILDGEVVAIGDDGKPRPFQDLLRRFRRKYDITEMVQKISVQLNLFDIMYLDGNPLIDTALEERHAILAGIVNEIDRILVARQVISSDINEIESVYRAALNAGHEGIMVKKHDSGYLPGKRGKNWLKLKPIMETLDLVVTNAQWGEGRRKNLMGSFMLACVDDASGQLLEVGRVGTGISDEQLNELTTILSDLIESESGTMIKVKPEVVFEVAFEEIQKSPTYESGFALRFPRLVRIRLDKSLNDIDSIKRIESLYG